MVPFHLDPDGADDPVEHRRLLAHLNPDPVSVEVREQSIEDGDGVGLEQLVRGAAADLDHALMHLAVVDRAGEVIGAPRGIEIHLEVDIDREAHPDFPLEPRQPVEAVKLDALEEDAVFQA